MKKLAFIKRSNGRHWVGDGFPVQNIFSYTDIATEMSPFLLMDYAGPIYFPPTSHKLGVGPHPHRGFETVTIVYDGGVSHRDSSGSGGTIGPGDVQWMTAASGVIHEEYHSPEFAAAGGAFEMIQLWVNLPAKDKMSAPHYQGIPSRQIPEVELAHHVGQMRIIAGEYLGINGAARTFTPMNIWDIQLNRRQRVQLTIPNGQTTALFVLRGEICFNNHQKIGASELAVMEREGNLLAFDVMEEAKLLLLSGEPLGEPIVGQGPFVMNTRQELVQAFNDFNQGNFGKINP